MTDMLHNALGWTFRQMQQYKTKEQLQAAHNMLQHIALEAERQRQKEEIKALRLEKELQAQRERLGRDLHDGLGSQLTHIISRLDLLACAGTPDPSQLLGPKPICPRNEPDPAGNHLAPGSRNYYGSSLWRPAAQHVAQTMGRPRYASAALAISEYAGKPNTAAAGGPAPGTHCPGRNY